MITFECRCGQVTKVSEKHAGKRARRLGCGQALVIPRAGLVGPSQPGAAVAEESSRCVHCGRAFHIGDVLNYRGEMVCKGCFAGSQHPGTMEPGASKTLLGSGAAAGLLAVAVPTTLYLVFRDQSSSETEDEHPTPRSVVTANDSGVRQALAARPAGRSSGSAREVSTGQGEASFKDEIPQPGCVVKGSLGSGQGSSGLLSFSDDSGMLNPFAWGIPLKYTHRGGVSGPGGQLVKVTYEGQVRDFEVPLEDAELDLRIRMLTVDGSLLFDRRRG